MANLYSIGTNRILYRARGFAIGRTITAYIWTPSLVQSSLLTLTEVDEGLYYLDYDFTEEGTYLGKFFENGIASEAGVFRVNDLITLLQSLSATTAGGLTVE